MPPHIHNTEIHQDSKIILFQGSKPEDQHTRKTLGTLSWVYKPSDNPIVIGTSNLCWSYQSQDLHPTKTVKGIETHIPLPKCDLFNVYVGQVALASESVTTTSWTLEIEGLIRMQFCVSSHTRDVKLAWKKNIAFHTWGPRTGLMAPDSSI